jgi:hypothetical protein
MQCNFFYSDRTTKYMEVKLNAKSKGVYFRPELSHRLAQCDQFVTKVDKFTQCVTTIITTKRKTEDLSLERSS